MDALAALLWNDNGQYVLENSFTPLSPNYFAFHHILIETFKQFPGGKSNFTKSIIMVPCEKMISTCRFGKISFDCCENVSSQVDDGGPCFDLRIDKIDEFLKRPRSPATPISFTFELITDWKHVLPLSTINGFFIHIDNPFTVFGQPIAVQAGTHAMIDLSQPSLKIDKSGCVDKGDTTRFGQYDSRGYFCKQERYATEIIGSFLHCYFPYGSFIPSENSTCTGVWTLPLWMIMSHGAAEYIPEGGHQKLMYDIINSNTRCLPLCTRWEYSPRPSYSDLINDDYVNPVGNNKSANISRTQVTIYIGSTYYMQQTEQAGQPFYKTFLLITDVTALYVGFSVVTLAEIVFYGCNLCLVYRKTRANMTKVAPYSI